MKKDNRFDFLSSILMVNLNNIQAEILGWFFKDSFTESSIIALSGFLFRGFW